MYRVLFVILIIPTLLLAQTNNKQDAWGAFKFFVGTWQGSSKGQSGVAKLEREYQFVLNGKFLNVKNKSTYAVQEKNPKGEVHEDLGLISYDKKRNMLVLRQFHVEGFVNQYTMDLPDKASKTLVFNTESIENIPAGFRARETYKIVNENEFIEIFELAEPGQDFEVYTESHFTRKK